MDNTAGSAQCHLDNGMLYESDFSSIPFAITPQEVHLAVDDETATFDWFIQIRTE
jgi:hypothetical protein